jgi:cell division protein DivIC
MSRANGAKNLGRKRRIQTAVFICLIIMTWIAYNWYTNNSIAKEKELKLQELTEKVEQLKKEQAKLDERYRRLDNEEYIAELARKYYFLSKPDELIFITPTKP